MDINNYTEITDDLKRRKIPAPIKAVVTAMLEKKAEKIVVLKLKGISEVTDFMVICTGQSQRQNKAIVDEITRRMKKNQKLKVFNIEGERSSEWVLLDYIDFIIHVFSPENRDKFSLEKLWMDATRYNFYIA